MNASRRDTLIEEMFRADLELLSRKGHDYSGDGDCMGNLRRFGGFGIVVRLSDKFSRLEALTKVNNPKVLDESLIDTLRDIRNYCYLLQIFLENKENT